MYEGTYAQYVRIYVKIVCYHNDMFLVYIGEIFSSDFNYSGVVETIA